MNRPPCFECGEPSQTDHHVVPKSLGGTKTIPLCAACHGKAHYAEGRKIGLPGLTSAALRGKRDRGEKTGGTIPFGFNLSGNGMTLVANSDEQQAISIMLAMRTEHKSYRDICRALSKSGYHTKTGAKWHPQTVRNICERT